MSDSFAGSGNGSKIDLYGKYSGADGSLTVYDMIAYINMPIANINGQFSMQPIPLGNINTISISSFRDKTEARVIGKAGTQGFVGGPRTVAGSLIFSNLNIWDFKNILYQANNAISNNKNTTGYYLPESIYADELPPFDIYVKGMSEQGVAGGFKILGVTILGDSTSLSTSELLINNTYIYKALDKTPMSDTEFRSSIQTNNLNNPVMNNIAQSNAILAQRNATIPYKNIGG